MKTTKAKMQVILLSMGMVAGNAMAALDQTAVTAIQTEVIGDVAIAAAAAMAILAVSLGWDVGISLVKKFVKRGA